MKNLATQSFAGYIPSPSTHNPPHPPPPPKGSLPSLISTETHTKQPFTYPLQPRKVLVHINVPIHAGHPCQQLDSLVEKPFFWPETKFSPPPCLCPSPWGTSSCVQVSPHPWPAPSSLCLNSFRYTRAQPGPGRCRSSPAAPTDARGSQQT